MADVFISYSRQDQEFVRRLFNALDADGRGAWVDWEGIPLTADWLAEIHSAVESADTFVFVISPDSATSQVCAQEIDHAVKNNKRLVPIVYRDVDPASLHPAAAAINWIFIRDIDDFDAAFHSLLDALDTDLEWNKAHTRLLVRSVEWDSGERDKSLLVRGSDLEDAERWLAKGASRSPGPTELQTDYILISRQEATRMQRRTLMAVAGGLALTLVLCVIAAIAAVIANKQAGIARTEANNRATQEAIALTQRAVAEQEANSRATQQAIAEEQTRLALSRLMAVQAQNHLEEQLDLSLLLGIEAVKLDDSPETRGSLIGALSYNPYLQGFLYKYSSPQGVLFLPDGRLVSTGGEDDVTIWNLDTLKEEAAFNEDDISLSSAALSPDGTMLATVALGDPAILLWDMETGHIIGDPMTAHTAPIESVAFSPDGRYIASSSQDGSIILWDAARQLRTFGSLIGQNDYVTDIAFSPNGTLLASSGRLDDSIVLWEFRSGRKVATITADLNGARPLAFSPDGRILAAGGNGDFIRLWDVSNASTPSLITSLPQGSILSLAFDPIGSLLAAGDSDNTIMIWDMATDTPATDPLTLHNGWPWSLSFSPDGSTLASGGSDEKILLWSIHPSQTLAQSSPDIAEGSVLDWLDAKGSLAVNWGTVAGSYGIREITAISPDANRKAVWDVENADTIKIWNNLSAGDPAISATIEYDQQYGIYGMAFSHDGTKLAVAALDDVQLVDTAAGTPIGEPMDAYYKGANVMAFSPDDRTLAIGNIDSFVALYDTVNQVPLGEPLPGHAGIVDSIAFNPDGTILASAACDRENDDGLCGGSAVLLWDVNRQQSFSAPFLTFDSKIADLVFSPDGQSLIALSGNHIVVGAWDLQVGTLEESACQMANRNLTEAEWALYLGNLKYDLLCP